MSVAVALGFVWLPTSENQAPLPRVPPHKWRGASILRRGGDPQVIWVYAAPMLAGDSAAALSAMCCVVMAAVINLKILWDWANVHLVGNSVRTLEAGLPGVSHDLDGAVSVDIHTPPPKPALPINIPANPGKSLLLRVTSEAPPTLRIAVSSKSFVVGVAEIDPGHFSITQSAFHVRTVP